MSKDSFVDRYITLAFEHNGFLDPVFEFDVSYCQGDHCSLQRASVNLLNESLLNDLWPCSRFPRLGLVSARNRRNQEVCRQLAELGMTASVTSNSGFGIEVEVDLEEIVSTHLRLETDNVEKLERLAGVSRDKLGGWAEELGDYLGQGIKEHAVSVGEKIYSVLHSACLNFNAVPEEIKRYHIGDYSVVLQTIHDEECPHDIAGEHMEDDMVISHMMMLARDKIQGASINCVIEHLPSGLQASETFWGLLVPYGDKTFGGFLWDAFSDAKAEMRSLMKEEFGSEKLRSAA